MNRNFPQNKRRVPKAKKFKRARKTGYNQQPSGAYHYRPAIGPTKALKMPAEFSVALVNTDYDSFTAATGYALRRFGIVEFLAYRPLYTLQLYAMYKYCRVTAVSIELKVVNTSTSVPLVLALGQAPYADSSALTPDRAWETPGTKRQLVSVQGGLDRATIRRTFTGQDAYGQPYLDQKYWVNVAQSGSTTPIDQNEPVAYFMISDTAGAGGFSCKVEFKITYHLQFFDLEIPASSINKRDFDTFDHVESEREDMYSNAHTDIIPPSRDRPIGINPVKMIRRGF